MHRFYVVPSDKLMAGEYNIDNIVKRITNCLLGGQCGHIADLSRVRPCS